MAQKPKLKYMTILILYYATFFLLSKLNQINKLILTVQFQIALYQRKKSIKG